MIEPETGSDRGGLRNLRGLIVLLTLTACALPVAASDFRGVAWGAGKAEVRAVEKYPLHHDIENEIAYWNFELAGVEAGLVYTFEDGKLVRAHYLSRHSTSDPEEDLADYLAFQRLFAEHFGEPSNESWVWADGIVHDEGAQSIEALTSGRAKRVTRWDLETATVRLLIAGRDGEIQTVRAIFEPR